MVRRRASESLSIANRARKRKNPRHTLVGIEAIKKDVGLSKAL
jgi:hypothetical protein